MAYAALVSLNQAIDLILNRDNYFIYAAEREQITSISQHVNLLISFLEKFPEKANSLEEKIRDLANEAEDLINKFMRHRRRRLRWFFFGLFGAGKFEQKLKRLREEWSTVGDMMDLPAPNSSPRVAAATPKNDVVVGLDEDLLAIKGRLCGASSKLEIIPIVGMGGIGKTTLARKVYDDPLIVEHFDIHAFVQVSQDYSAKEFLSNLLASLGEKYESGIPENEYTKSQIVLKVYQSLKGRRYMIVMDDIWSTEAWDDVRNVFPDDNNGSRIMLTTRLSNVAAYASCGSTLHEMKFMDENRSWNLLKQKVFGNGQDCTPQLEDVGKAIARGCRGLPLAVVLVSGVLSTINKTRASWEEIAENVNSVVDGQLDKILALSYTHLPCHLRPCFLFMACIPEGYSIRVSMLIKLWVAEGFVNGESLEKKAEMYVEDLVERSLVLVREEKCNGKMKSCCLHDLVREMCIRKAQEEKFLLTDGRISVGNPRLNRLLTDSYNWDCSPTTRTILCFGVLDQSSLAFIVRFNLLRVLHIMRCRNMFYTDRIFELIHLKYLALGFTFVIPAAISNFQNLQTLIVGTRTGFSAEARISSYLPHQIWRMPQLRHVRVHDSFKLPDPADGLPLENLQTLLFVRSFSCSKRMLKMFPNLKKLGLVYFKHKVHHLLHNLEDLQHLEKLKIDAQGRFSWKGRINPVFPSSLKTLSLVGGGLPWEDMSIVGSLPNLQVLKLLDNACDGDTWETTDGEFPQLRYLQIGESNLQHWITESNHFPRLKRLVLDCYELTEIPVSIGEIATLEWIMVDALNQSLMDSAKEIQRVQHEECGNDAFRVYAINIKR